MREGARKQQTLKMAEKVGSEENKAKPFEEPPASALSLIDRLLGRVPNKVYALGCLAPVAAVVLPHLKNQDPDKKEARLVILLSLCVSVLVYWATVQMIPLVGKKLINKLNGVDLGKLPRQPPIPQSLGLISGTGFMVALIMTETLMPLITDKFLFRPKYDSIMLSICFSVLLGFADDVMDIKWGHKVMMGLLYSLPLVTSYDGPTSILLPTVFRPIILSQPIQFVLGVLHCSTSLDGVVLELGVFYLAYIIALTIFCTNAINIYAGINGIEVGQSLIIACGIAIIDAQELVFSTSGTSNFHNHLLSLTIMLPFIATSLALLNFNWFPAKVFIGDIFPYYAGMTLASTAVHGHYSRSLLLLMVPQVLNYLYSVPQIFGLVPCPRHRLPAVNPQTKLLEPSRVGEGDPRANMTLICLGLRIFGPMRERTLTIVLLIFQTICTVLFGLVGRLILGKILFA